MRYTPIIDYVRTNTNLSDLYCDIKVVIIEPGSNENRRNYGNWTTIDSYGVTIYVSDDENFETSSNNIAAIRIEDIILVSSHIPADVLLSIAQVYSSIIVVNSVFESVSTTTKNPWRRLPIDPVSLDKRMDHNSKEYKEVLKMMQSILLREIKELSKVFDTKAAGKVVTSSSSIEQRRANGFFII